MQFELSKSFLFFLQALANIIAFIAVAFLVVNIVHAVKSRISRKKFEWKLFDLQIILLMVCFAFLGFAIGLMIGLSQSPVVQVAIPAMMTFYGGFITYLFAKDSFKDNHSRYATIFSVMAVSVFVIYGIEVGSAEKNNSLEAKRKFDLYYFEKEEAIKKKYR